MLPAPDKRVTTPHGYAPQAFVQGRRIAGILHLAPPTVRLIMDERLKQWWPCAVAGKTGILTPKYDEN
jgi:hypothetical protein